MSLRRTELGSHLSPAISQLGDLGGSFNTKMSATLAETLGQSLVLGIIIMKAQSV